MENLKNKGTLSVGSLLIGAAIGATLGVLFAPHKGEKTRKNIANSVKNTANKFQKEISEDSKYLKDKATEFGNLVEDNLSNGVTAFKDKANELLHKGSDHEMTKNR